MRIGFRGSCFESAKQSENATVGHIGACWPQSPDSARVCASCVDRLPALKGFEDSKDFTLEGTVKPQYWRGFARLWPRFENQWNVPKNDFGTCPFLVDPRYLPACLLVFVGVRKRAHRQSALASGAVRVQHHGNAGLKRRPGRRALLEHAPRQTMKDFTFTAVPHRLPTRRAFETKIEFLQFELGPRPALCLRRRFSAGRPLCDNARS